MNLITVIIPYRNRAASLERALQSVRLQSYRPLQLILIDNGSTDGSGAIATTFKEKYETPAFSIINGACPQKGASRARNCGLEKARGGYVYFFDSDDEMSPDYIKTVAGMAYENGLDAVFSVTDMIKPDGTTVPRAYGYSMNPIRQILAGMLSTQSMFVSRQFLIQTGRWNEHLPCWNDWELGLRLLLAHPKARWYKEKPFHRIYQHPDSLTGNNYSHNCDNIIKALRAARADLDNCHEPLKARCTRALLYRSAIMAALCRREGSPQCARRLWNTFDKGWLTLPAALLYAYTRLGGRGAWRIAIWLA